MVLVPTDDPEEADFFTGPDGFIYAAGSGMEIDEADDDPGYEVDDDVYYDDEGISYEDEYE